MPDKPIWYARLNEIIATIRSLHLPWIDRQTVEFVFGVGRRRANQILAPCVRHQVGRNGLAEREEFLTYLERIAAGDSAHDEHRRRQKLALQLDALQRARRHQPVVLVAAPVATVSQKIEQLPSGVSIRPGEISVHFCTPTEALEKLLALAMAIGNDIEQFERLAAPADGHSFHCKS